MRKARHPLFQVWNMPCPYRPHDKMWRSQSFEPVALAVVELLVDRRPNEPLQRFDALPHGQIDRHGRLLRVTDGARIVPVVLEAPDESLATLRESIDAIEIRHERRHARII